MNLLSTCLWLGLAPYKHTAVEKDQALGVQEEVEAHHIPVLFQRISSALGKAQPESETAEVPGREEASLKTDDLQQKDRPGQQSHDNEGNEQHGSASSSKKEKVSDNAGGDVEATIEPSDPLARYLEDTVLRRMKGNSRRDALDRLASVVSQLFFWQTSWKPFQGWACPKCGMIMDGSQGYCSFCPGS